MISRYNPHNLQKQIKLFFSEHCAKDLDNDILRREEFIWSANKKEQQNPNIKYRHIPQSIVEEYGIDVSRIYNINTTNSCLNESLYESCYKWVNSVYSYFSLSQIRTFDVNIWLKAIFQSKDYLINMNRKNLALAKLRRAMKISPPNMNLSAKYLKLVLYALYPFIPVLTSYFIDLYKLGSINEISINKLLEKDFQDYIPIKFSFEKSGWNWEIFNRLEFNENPKQAFLNIPWVNTIIADNDFEVISEDKGYKLCLKI